MPDLASIIASVFAALGGGAAGVTMGRRRPAPGTLDDHEDRLSDLEARLTTLERDLAASIDRLSDSTERVWRALDAAGETLAKLHDKVTRIDIETGIERGLRQGGKP